MTINPFYAPTASVVTTPTLLNVGTLPSTPYTIIQDLVGLASSGYGILSGAVSYYLAGRPAMAFGGYSYFRYGFMTFDNTGTQYHLDPDVHGTFSSTDSKTLLRVYETKNALMVQPTNVAYYLSPGNPGVVIKSSPRITQFRAGTVNRLTTGYIEFASPSAPTTYDGLGTYTDWVNGLHWQMYYVFSGKLYAAVYNIQNYAPQLLWNGATPVTINTELYAEPGFYNGIDRAVMDTVLAPNGSIPATPVTCGNTSSTQGQALSANCEARYYTDINGVTWFADLQNAITPNLGLPFSPSAGIDFVKQYRFTHPLFATLPSIRMFKTQLPGVYLINKAAVDQTTFYIVTPWTILQINTQFYCGQLWMMANGAIYYRDANNANPLQVYQVDLPIYYLTLLYPNFVFQVAIPNGLANMTRPISLTGAYKS